MILHVQIGFVSLVDGQTLLRLLGRKHHVWVRTVGVEGVAVHHVGGLVECLFRIVNCMLVQCVLLAHIFTLYGALVLFLSESFVDVV